MSRSAEDGDPAMTDDQFYQQQLDRMNANHQENLDQLNQLYAEKNSRLLDGAVDMVQQNHRMYGDGAVGQVAQHYLHQAGPSGGQYLLAIAQRLHQRGNPQAAIALYKSILNHRPQQ
jgi:hypothetical protein